MRLRKIRVEGFQSFLDSGDIEFTEGVNLIIGQNNSGKSALLRALQPTLPDDRHRIPERWEAFQLPKSKITFTIEASGVEIRNWALRSGQPQIFPVNSEQVGDVLPVMSKVFQLASVVITCTRTHDTVFSATYPSHDRFAYQPPTEKFGASMTPADGELKIGPYFGGDDTLPNLYWNAWNTGMFYFMAERMAIGEAPVGHALRLAPNASNLPTVLNTLSSERRGVFERLVGHVREIFPTVGNLNVRLRPDNGLFEIRVWPTLAMEQVELSFPLNSSGTGVAQAIAILTAIMTVENAVIVIDEINSFLHPAAVKALLRILQTKYGHHQYIISTHAPEVIGFSNPKIIHLVKRSGYNSSIERLNLTKLSEFREVAEHLGVSMADVFAADRVIWVEGPTEELCFPFLYQSLSGKPMPLGTIITSVAATGDFNRKRNREIVYEVYSRLSSAAATLVVATAFSFDTEQLTDAEKAEMVKESGGRLSFLPRRHFECYLIDPVAIANMIVAKDPGSVGAVTRDAVKAKLVALASDKKFAIPEWDNDLDNTDWLAKVDAAKLIAQATTDLSGVRAEFNKKEDSLALLQQILEREPEKLRPLYEYVAALVTKVTSAN